MNIKSLNLLLFTAALLSFEGFSVAETTPPVSFSLQSNSFSNQGEIPTKFTCEGDDISPHLNWTGIPQNTKSLVLIVDDPNAPIKTWVHWLLYNIPATVNELPKNLKANNLPPGTLEGKNSWNKTGYGGPCPPRGRHRYFFKLYALNSVLPDLKKPDKNKLEAAMQGHIIGQAVLTEYYQKKSKHFLF